MRGDAAQTADDHDTRPAMPLRPDELSGFRTAFYRCLSSRADTLFELTDALLCADRPVTTLVGLSLAPEHRRGHGSLYDALNHGGIDDARLRTVLAGLPIPRGPDGRIVLGVDVSNWLRPDAATSPQRLFCHTYGRGRGQAQMVPGWPYSFVAALETGRSSWSALLDAVRLGPDDDATVLAGAQLRAVVTGLIARWRPRSPRAAATGRCRGARVAAPEPWSQNPAVCTRRRRLMIEVARSSRGRRVRAGQLAPLLARTDTPWMQARDQSSSAASESSSSTAGAAAPVPRRPATPAAAAMRCAPSRIRAERQVPPARVPSGRRSRRRRLRWRRGARAGRRTRRRRRSRLR